MKLNEIKYFINIHEYWVSDFNGWVYFQYYDDIFYFRTLYQYYRDDQINGIGLICDKHY